MHAHQEFCQRAIRGGGMRGCVHHNQGVGGGRQRRLAGRCTLLILTGLLALVLAACGSGRATTIPSLVEPVSPVTGTPTGEPPPTRIALVMKTFANPFFVEMERGARQAEAELQVDLIVKTPAQETAIDQQIAIIERLILDQVDAIVIAPGDSASLIPVLKRAQDAGIIIVNIDDRLDPTRMRELGLADVPFIGVDNEEGAYLAARHLSRQLAIPADVLILEGIPTARNAVVRTQGALRAFREHGNITITAIETAHWKIDEAYTVTRRLIEAHPEIDAIFCGNDMMALGAIQYLAETGRAEVRVAGFDALDEARQAVNDGRLMVTVDQQAARQGYLGITYAVRLLAGETLPPETMIPVALITSDNQ